MFKAFRAGMYTAMVFVGVNGLIRLASSICEKGSKSEELVVIVHNDSQQKHTL